MSKLPFLFILTVASLLSVNLQDCILFKFPYCMRVFSLFFCVLFSGEVEGEKRKNIPASLKIIQALSVVMSASYHQVALLRWEKHSI